MSAKTKHRIVVLTLLVAVVLSACASPTPTPTPPPATKAPEVVPTKGGPASTSDDSWDKVKAAGKLVVGTSADYAPFESYNSNYQIAGFDIALIDEVAKQLGVTVELNDFAFDGLGSAVRLGQVDTAISAISVTPERQAVVDFSNVYYATTDAILVKADSTLNAQTPNLLTTTRLGVQQGSVYEGYAQTKLIDTGKMPARNLNVYQDMGAAISRLEGWAYRSGVAGSAAGAELCGRWHRQDCGPELEPAAVWHCLQAGQHGAARQGQCGADHTAK